MKYKYHSRKVRQLDRLIKEMKQAMRARQPKVVVERIRKNIALLIQQLRGVLSSHQLVQKLGALAIVFGLASTSNAQQFSAPVQDPFGFTQSPMGYIGGIATADFDFDGDYDIFLGGDYGSLLYYENTGTSSSPVFDTAMVNPFGLTNAYYYAFLTSADIDDDGDIDLLAGEYYGDILYYENIGSAAAPSFAAPVPNPFGLNAGSALLTMPELVDIDDDGDYDLLAGVIEQYNVDLSYFENIGTASGPSFTAPVNSPFNIVSSSSYFVHPTTADLDSDGDLDLLLGEYYGNFSYYENTGSSNNPNFAAPQANPFGLVGAAADLVFPAFVDIDGDGDYDILASGYYGSLLFFENEEFDAGLDELESNVTISPNPFQNEIKLSGDTEIDLLEVFDMKGTLVFSKEDPTAIITLEDLNQGMYMVQVTDINGRMSRKKMQKI